MTQAIQPPAPVNNVVTIQPVTTAIPNRDTGAAQNPLANLAQGTTVEGFVVNRDAQNNPIVRTAIGDLSVGSDVFLKTGSEVVFKVDPSQNSLARIVSVDGMTLQDYDASNTHGITKDTISTSLLQPTNPQQPAQAGKPGTTPLPVLQALILQGTPEAAPNATSPLKLAQSQPMPLLAQLAQLRAGTPLRLTVLDLKLPPLPISINALPQDAKLESLLPARPQTAPAAAPHTLATGKLAAAPATEHAPVSQPATATKPATAAPAVPNAPAQPAATQAAVAPFTAPEDETAILKTILQAAQGPIAQRGTADHSADTMLMKSELMAQYGKSAAASTAHYTPPAQHSAANASGYQPPSAAHPAVTIPIPATVIGHEADGANILHTSFATLKLYTPQPLPTGTTLTVQASHEAPVSQTGTAQPAVPEPFTATTTRNWQSLDDAMQWLKQTNPDIANDAAQRLPVANHKLASGLLFFINAIKTNDLSEIVGKRAARLMELSAPALLSKLRADLTQIQTNLVDSPLSNWSIAQLPMLFGQEIQHAQLYVSKDPSGATEEEKKERGHRFILEVGMSQLGPMQLDGFVRTSQGTKSFDLVVRSGQALDAEVSQGISAIFSNSMEVTGMQGRVLFQSGAQHFFRPAAEPKARPDAAAPNTILA